MEYSAVPIPANPGATLQRSDADLICKTLGDDFLSKQKDDTFMFVTPFKKEQEIKQAVIEPNKNDLETTLKSLIELAQVVRKEKLDEQKLLLIKTSMEVLNEIILSNTEGVSQKEFNELKEMVESLAKMIQERNPDPQDFVSKFMTQFEMALRSHRA